MRRNGGMLQSLKVGLSEGSSENLNRSYAYNSFGDVSALTEDTTSYAFTYDGLGRLTAAYGRTYSYDGANRLTAFNGQQLGYGDAGPYHAVDRIGNADRFDYDANGNMTKRSKGLADQQTLVWNAENRLSEVQDNNGNLLESYWYDIGGSRVKKTSGNTTSYTFFGHYEEEVSGGSTTEIRHYSFGSLRIAVKRGSTLYHMHGDHLGSTSLTTAGSAVEASRAYYAYGSERSASGDLQTDRTFTGQKSDATGLLYYNARYYDPALGTFISPDSLVPDPGRVISYNRFLYAEGNPLKYTDPSGHIAVCFSGGFLKDEDMSSKTHFINACKEILRRIGYVEGTDGHGEIRASHGRSEALEVYEDIRDLKTGEQPSPEPVILICYSWGCPDAMAVAENLTGEYPDKQGNQVKRHEAVQVDRVVMLEAENFGKPMGGVPNNVVATNNYFAENAEEMILFSFTIPTMLNISPTSDGDRLGISIGLTTITLFAWEWTWANGLNYVEGAHNVGVEGDHYTFWNNLPYDDIGRDLMIAN